MTVELRSLCRARFVRTGTVFLGLTTACEGIDIDSLSPKGTGGATTTGSVETVYGTTSSGGQSYNNSTTQISNVATGGGNQTPVGNGGAATTRTTQTVGGTKATGSTATNAWTTATGGTATNGRTTATGSTVATGGTTTNVRTTATGGTVATGGTTTHGRTTATGGTVATGGTTSITITTSGMRNIPSMQLVKEMSLGWNLGNTLDAHSLEDDSLGTATETYWGNPRTTQAMIDAVKAKGFNTVRVPVTWSSHIGAAPNYTVDEAWMARVEEVVSYVHLTGMYAIVNTHHDEWVSVMPNADQAAISTKLTKLWTQIANRFKNYDDHLIFETLNEPRTTDSTQWTGGTAAARTILNAYNLAAVNAIRATGGNNAVRHIMIPTHGANSSNDCINDLVIPNNDERIIVSLHAYYPYFFSMDETAETGVTTWGTAAEVAAMTAELDRIYNLLPKKGRAVVFGEWGTVDKNNTSARVTHANTYAKGIAARGMCPIWWDNGSKTTQNFTLLDRETNPPTWLFPEIANALVTGAATGAASAP